MLLVSCKGLGESESQLLRDHFSGMSGNAARRETSSECSSWTKLFTNICPQIVSKLHRGMFKWSFENVSGHKSFIG